MSIRPVSSVSFSRSLNQVNFEGKKKEKIGAMSVPAAIKAIPIATLIAMSPLNSVDAQTRADHNNEDVLNIQRYTGPAEDRSCNVFFISNDGDNNNFEKIALGYQGEKVRFHDNVNGQSITVIKSTTYKQYADELKVVNVTYRYEDGSPDEHAVQYFVTGPRISYVIRKNAETERVLSRREGYSQNQEYQIDRALYEYLSQYYSPVTPENKIVKIKDTDPLDLFD